MEFEHILLEIDDLGVATITLNRPEVANALDLKMSQELLSASRTCDAQNVRAIILTGAGKLFSGGGDLGYFAKQPDFRGAIAEMTSYLHGAISRFVRMDAPVIAAVNGTAGGAGFSLVCMADLAIISERAKLTLAYTAAGLTPDGSSTYFLPRLIGLRRANELALTNRRLTAAEALEWGLVNQVVPADEVMPAARTLATQLAAGPTRAYGAATRLMRQSLEYSFETQMENEAQTFMNNTRNADAQEGIDAFLNKRQPKFTGK